MEQTRINMLFIFKFEQKTMSEFAQFPDAGSNIMENWSWIDKKSLELNGIEFN